MGASVRIVVGGVVGSGAGVRLGVLVVIAPPWMRVAQPMVSLVRLQAAQRPSPLRRSVTPPLLTARAWSVCRI
ncbi:MAG TPA: hypothetical protein VIU87_23420, partial [Mycobacterium sp.]